MTYIHAGTKSAAALVAKAVGVSTRDWTFVRDADDLRDLRIDEILVDHGDLYEVWVEAHRRGITTRTVAT